MKSMRFGKLLIERVDGPVASFRLTGESGGARIGEDGLGREYRGDSPLRSATRAALAAAIHGEMPLEFTPCLHAVQRRAAHR